MEADRAAAPEEQIRATLLLGVSNYPPDSRFQAALDALDVLLAERQQLCEALEAAAKYSLDLPVFVMRKIDAALAVVRDPSRLEDPLEGANCSLCGATADNFHVSDELWERVGLGQVQACFKCFRIAAWHKGITPDLAWEVTLVRDPSCDCHLHETQVCDECPG